MALTPGSRLGVYELTALIGGGMLTLRCLRDTPAAMRVEINKPATPPLNAR